MPGFRRFYSPYLLFAVALAIGCGGGGGGGATSGGSSGGGSTGGAFNVLYSTDKDGLPRIYRVASNGAGQTALGLASLDSESPALSPDHGKIAFVVAGDDFYFHLYTMNPDGSGVAQITQGTQDDTSPAFTPDNSKILFSSNRSGATQLFRANAADGSGIYQISHEANGARQGELSPDGTKIVYVVGGATDDVWIMNADGSGAMPLAADPNIDENQPAFSADGSQVAFVAALPSGETTSGQIFVIPAAGGTAARITTTMRDDRHPSYSPDGQAIVFTRGVGGHREVYKMASDGSGQTAVTNDGATATAPATG